VLPYDGRVASGQEPAQTAADRAAAGGRGPAKAAPLRRTMAAVVADRLRTMILQGELPPGDRVVVQPLADAFGVSQIPIREALRQLQAEGLVINEPQRGVTVAPMSAQDLLDLYDFRRLIEPEITVRALELARPGRDGELRQALSRLYETIDDPGSDQYMQEHSAFHWALIAPAASPVMRRVVELLWQMSERYIRLTVASPEHRRVYAHHHEPLVAAMESGDANRVREEMIRHLSEAEEVVLGPRDS
jgi:DNA-binding GntR family transcriptional regulator